jgi:hypothetical protein
VRLRLAMSPWWAQGLVYGLLFGFLMTLFFRLDEDSWFPALVSGPMSGLLFGTVMGLTMSRINGRMLVGLEDFSSSSCERWHALQHVDPRRTTYGSGRLRRYW